MSITFDTERWSNPLQARDFEQMPKQRTSPRLVSLAELPYFKSSPDVKGEAFFRLLGFEEDTSSQVDRKR